MPKTISTDAAPAAIGPYSQAIRAGDLLFVSGQIALDPDSGSIVPGTVRAQTRQVLRNLGAILDAAGVGFDAVVKTTIFLSSMESFSAVNEEYAEVFGAHRPARATVEVSRLPKDVEVEIEAIAYLGT